MKQSTINQVDLLQTNSFSHVSYVYIMAVCFFALHVVEYLLQHFVQGAFPQTRNISYWSYFSHCIYKSEFYINIKCFDLCLFSIPKNDQETLLIGWSMVELTHLFSCSGWTTLRHIQLYIFQVTCGQRDLLVKIKIPWNV